MFEKIKNAFSRHPAAKWDQLSRQQKTRVCRNIKAMMGPRYKIVSGFDQLQRERGTVESSNEDQILDIYSRGRLLDQVRNQARNSSTFNTILKSFDMNTVGVQGGKVIVTLDDVALANELRDRFAQWTLNSDFFDGFSFNQLLKLILKTQLINGDCCILFDDGLVEDSGKLLVYESDEIGAIPDDVLATKYGKSARQSMGKVYNRNGRFIGAIVSRSQRGKEVFDPKRSYLLHRDPDDTPFDNLWLMPQNVWRIGQGRGITQTASCIGTIQDLEDTVGFEIQAAKKNAQMFAQIVNTGASSEESLPSAFDSDDIESMSDEEIEEAIKAEQVQTVALDKAMSCGIIYEAMPENYKMELLNTAHPNEKMQDFIEWLCSRSASPLGLAKNYALLNPDASNYKAQMLMTQPVWDDCQKQLEKICDWCFYRFLVWESKRDTSLMTKIPSDIMRHIRWSWPKANELDENAHQDAIVKKLSNLTGTYLEALGPDWREKLNQIKQEIDWCKRNGLPHPAYNMISGGERTGADVIVD